MGALLIILLYGSIAALLLSIMWDAEHLQSKLRMGHYNGTKTNKDASAGAGGN